MKKDSTNGITIVTCGHCSGTGRVHLSNDMQATLDIVRKMKRGCAAQVGHRLKWIGNPTAINNRLHDLMEYGFLIRHREGRHWIYQPTKA